MTPNDWGPPLWKKIHQFSMVYNPETNNSTEFINHIKRVIPCNNCKKHIEEYVEKHDIVQSSKSREELQKYFFKFHNAVNKRLNKKQISYHQFLTLYDKDYTGRDYKTIIGVGVPVCVFITFLMFGIIYGVQKRKKSHIK
tara:strand:+ start:697 stop:1116 length:420 start_codon:yes stop_codon:yes gene_type:complete